VTEAVQDSRDRPGTELAPPAELPDDPASGAARDAVLAALVPPIVHRLNNALSVLRGLAELQRSSGSASRAELARAEAQRASATLARLSTFAKDFRSAPEAFDLGALVEGEMALLEPLAEAHGVALQVERAPAWAMAAREPVARAFVSLAAQLVLALGPRAGRRTGSPPHLRSTTTTIGGRVLLVLAHPGRRGLSLVAADELARAWPATMEFLRDSGASLAARSLAGRAIAWRFLFRAASVGQDAAAASAARPAARSRRARRILLVESDRGLAELVETLLSEAGYRVQVASGPESALEAAGAGVFELVLVDCDVERENVGLVLRLERTLTPARLGPEPRATQVAFLGGSAGLAGARVALHKPFRPHEILAFVRTILD
jgi:CheY-like chemotaxis protein